MRRLTNVGRPRLSRRRWLGVTAGVVLVALLVAADRFGTPLIGSGATAGVSASPGLPIGTSPSSTAASSGGSGAASTGAGPFESAAPTQTAPAASIVFRDLVLDSAVDPKRTARAFTFTSDGPGLISAQVVASSPMDATTLCLTMDDAPAACVTGATPGFPSAVTRTGHSRWTVTLASANESTPTIDVAFGWPSNNPSIMLASGRFQGSPNPDSLRTLTATFKPRTSGQATLDASWPPGVLNATVTLAVISAAKTTTVSEVRYAAASSTSPVYSAPVSSGKTYRLQLLNDDKDSLRPNLTATITFP